MNWLTNLRMLIFSIFGGVIQGFSDYELEPSHAVKPSMWAGLIGLGVTFAAQWLSNRWPSTQKGA